MRLNIGADGNIDTSNRLRSFSDRSGYMGVSLKWPLVVLQIDLLFFGGM